MRDLRKRILAIESLRILKKFYTHNDLSKHLGFSPTEISRYINFKVLPSEKSAEKILDFFNNFVDFRELILRNIRFDRNGFISNINLLYNIDILKMIAIKAFQFYKDTKIDKILTAAVDGIPLATVMGSIMNVDVIYAKKNKELGVTEYAEEILIPRDTSIVSYYIPKNLIKKGERILLVDDIMRSGATQKVLLNFVYRFKAKPVGIFVIVAIGDEWKKYFSGRIPVKYLVKL